MDFRKLMVATDGSRHAASAVIAAGSLAARLGAEVVVATVVESPGDDTVPPELTDLARAEHVSVTNYELSMQAAQRIVASAEAKLRELGVAKVSCCVETGDPATRLVEAAQRDKADMIVVGRRGLGRLGGLLLGSVSHKLLQASPIPCLVTG